MKKKKYLFHFLLLLSAAMSFWGCPRRVEKPATPLDPDFLQYVAFPKGSWWVYVEKNSLQRDSFYVERYEIGEEELDPYGADSKSIELGYYLRGLDTVRKYSIYTTEYRSPKHSDMHEWCSPCGLNTALYLRLYSPPSGDFHSDDSAFHVTQVDTLHLDNGIVYQDVLQTYRQKVGKWESYVKSEAYAKNVGLIRREYFNGQIWELEKYHIQ